jgi:hypothetical protein
MKRKTITTIQDVTEQDIRNAFRDAFDKLGIKAGEQIPAQMYDLREVLVDILFNQKKQMKELSAKDVHETYFFKFDI